MTFGERLKQLMDDKNITQRQISKELNIAVSTLNGYANDYRTPDFFTLASLAHYFNVSADYLLGISILPSIPDPSVDPDIQRLLYFYQNMRPETRTLLIEQAKLLKDFDSTHEIYAKEKTDAPAPAFSNKKNIQKDNIV
ncbi:MAG: helix-turn-helix transcriptional regulator [Lachnospiraceae bacterium]|nr:helix-turn-helix transcriptional regulator [Lachnospiraceae bacterium]